jgi:hypothetical protein
MRMYESERSTMGRRRLRRIRETIGRLIVGSVPRSWALATIACLALAGAASAASWSPAVTVGETATVISDPTITVAGHGSVLLGARFVDDPGPFREGDLRLFGGRHTTAFAEVGRFPQQFRVVRAYGARRAIIVLGRVVHRDRNHTPTVRLTYRIGTASGRFGASHTLWTGRMQTDPVVAASSDGDIAIAWVEVRGEFKDQNRLWLARRSRNAPFHRASVLAGSSDASAPSLAWDFEGNLLVAFARHFRAHGRAVRDVAVRVRRAGHRFGPVHSLGPSRGDTEIATAIAPSNRMYVAWGTQDGGEEANEPWRVYAATAISPAHRFAPVQTLDPGAGIDRPAGHVRLVVANDGSAVVGWSSLVRVTPDTFAYPARVASADPGGHFSAATQLSSSAAMEDLALGPDGAVLAVLSTLPHGNYQQGEQVVASIRPAGAAQFSALEPVSPLERALEARGAFDPTTGRPTVVWVGEPGAGPYGPPYTQQPQALRASTR